MADSPSETDQPETEAAQSAPQAFTFMVNAQYIKDFSFENPRAPNSLIATKEQPQVEVNVNVSAKALRENLYEVALAIRVDAKAADEPAFITELVYAGVFTIINLSEEQLRPMLLIECPRILFPFARRIIGDATRDGGFPPLLINPIDFADLYRRQYALEQQPVAGQA
ncbi:MAG: protein-export chaperone SecB [Alphaproteobacteria bacterium]